MDTISRIWLNAYGRRELMARGYTASMQGIFDPDGLLVWENKHGHIARVCEVVDGVEVWVIPQSVVNETLAAIPGVQ